MVYVFLLGLIVSPILTWAVDVSEGVYVACWAVTVVAMLMALNNNNIGVVVKLLFSAVAGGGCAGTIILLTVWWIGSTYWGLNMDKHAWYVGVPVYIVGGLLGTAMLYGMITKDEEEEQARKRAHQDLSEINKRLAGETREQRIRRITEQVKRERQERDQDS